MTDGAALLAAILVNPDCDATRLVYADALQEQGEEARAELIRVQVEKARLPTGLKLCHHPDFTNPTKGYSRGLTTQPYQCKQSCPLCRHLHCTARECALRTHAAKAKLPWTPDGLTYWLKAKPTGLALRDQQHLVGLFVRGMIEDVTGSAANWLRHATAILATHPVRKVTLTDPIEVAYIVRLVGYPPSSHLAPGCSYVVRVSGAGLVPAGEVRPDYCYLSSLATDELVEFFRGDFMPGADFDRAVLDRFFPGIAFELPPARPGVERYPVAPGAAIAAGEMVGLDEEGNVVPIRPGDLMPLPGDLMPLPGE